MRRSKWLATACVLSLLLAAFSANNGARDDDVVTGIASTGQIAMPQDDPTDAQPSLSSFDGDVDGPRFVVGAREMVSHLTGSESPARTNEHWNIAGTDLGISFEHKGKIYAVFGDTWGRDGVEGDDWRSNTMAIVEPDPTHGYVVTDVIADENGEAKEILPSLKRATMEYTVIPTAAISVGGRMYLHYQSLNDWKKKWWGYKEPVMNYSGLAYSDDDGQTWTKDADARWYGDSAFAQAAMVKDGGYVYVFGTPAGRFGAAKLFRVRGEHLLDKNQYEYWTGETWSSDVTKASDVVPSPVGELSVRWSEYHQRWLMMYKNEITHTIVLRTAEHLTGPWDDERVVVTNAEYPTMYAPFMLPITGPEVHFTMSIFLPTYQVFLMRFTL